MVDEVAGDERQAVLRADDRLLLRPLALQLLLALDLLALGDLLEVGVDPGAFGFAELELGEPALVVDRDGGPVDDRALDVVDADVVAEDGARARVGLLDRRPGEADERGVRERVAHVPGEAVDEVVLAAVGLVGDHHDVATVREDRVAVALLLGEELLDRREDDAPEPHPPFERASLHWFLDGQLTLGIDVPGRRPRRNGAARRPEIVGRSRAQPRPRVRRRCPPGQLFYPHQAHPKRVIRPAPVCRVMSSVGTAEPRRMNWPTALRGRRSRAARGSRSRARGATRR